MKAVISSLLFALGILPISVFAGEQSGLVMDIRVNNTSTYSGSHVFINGTYIARPECGTNSLWWVFDTDTSTGKVMLATLLTAKATGKTVILWGSGGCALRPGMETIVQVSIQP